MSADGSFTCVIALVIFSLSVVFTIALVLTPASVPIPRSNGRRIQLSYCWAPVAGVLLMLACQSMTFPDVGRGLLGSEGIKPYGAYGA
jgi:hypothetical protein